MPKDDNIGISSETIEVLNNRRSIRTYSDAPVTDAHIEAILGAALRAPTSSNLQAYSVVVVRDSARKKRLAELAGNQQHVITCPVFLAFCADLSRIDAALQRYDHDLKDNNLEMGLVSSIDATLVGMAAYVAADSLGIQGVMIGAMRNDPEAVAELLDLPARAYVVFGMCLGFPDGTPPKQKPRMPRPGIVHQESYDHTASKAGIDIYNNQLRAHYEAIGKETNTDSWTHEVDSKFAARPRNTLRAALKRLGLDFS